MTIRVKDVLLLILAYMKAMEKVTLNLNLQNKSIYLWFNEYINIKDKNSI